MVKKFSTLLIFIVLMILPLGCNGKKERTNFEETKIPDGSGNSESLNDNGVFYTKKGVVYFFDPETRIKMPLCSKANCEHRGSSHDNSHPTCDAYFGQAVGYSAIVKDKLYCMVRISDEADGEKGLFTKEFYKADKNGTDRKLLFRADDIQYGTYAKYENGYFLYGYYNAEDPNGKELEIDEVGMCVFNLETEKLTRIYPENRYGGRIVKMTVSEGKLYYGLSYMTKNLKNYNYEYFSDLENSDEVSRLIRDEVWVYDIETGNTELVFRTGIIPQFSFGYDHLYYSEDNKEHIIRDLVSGKEVRIIKENVNIQPLMIPEGIVFCDNGRIELWKYETEELEKIGDYSEDQNIMLQFITGKWVYAIIYNDDEFKRVYCPQKDFMEGRFEWKEYDIE